DITGSVLNHSGTGATRTNRSVIYAFTMLSRFACCFMNKGLTEEILGNFLCHLAGFGKFGLGLILLADLQFVSQQRRHRDSGVLRFYLGTTEVTELDINDLTDQVGD